MSTNDNTDNIVSVCANCGKGEEEIENLKSCTACKMVKYCSRECQIAHRSQHKKECRKRAAELHDEKLFKQPPPLEDCPICFLRIPTFETGSKYYECCGKIICSGCMYAPVYDDQGNEEVDDNKKCPFCRIPAPYTDEEIVNRLEKRMEAGDAYAIFIIGLYYEDGTNGYPQDSAKALELWHRAGELGHDEAYCNIGYAYNNGLGVEIDKKKAKHYWELAAMRGDAKARYNLGAIGEEDEDNIDRSIKHYMIAVAGGNVDSLQRIKLLYTNGHVTKADYTKASQSYQAYMDEIKSKQRDKAAAAREDYRYYSAGIAS